MATRGHAPRPRARAAVVPLRARSGFGLGRRLARLLPSGRSLAIGFALVGLAVGGYQAARSTSVFAVEHIEVHGAPASGATRVRAVLRPVVGESLLTLDPDEVEARVAALPTVADVSYDRSFPHTLVVSVVLERAVAVVRRGEESWLVSQRGRVLRRLDRGARADLARIWIPPVTPLVRGGYVGDPAGARAVRALGVLVTQPLPVSVRTVRGERGELAFRLASGVELVLGSEQDLRLKLAVAARILDLIAPRWEGGPAYLDVSVPERPVAGGYSQVEG